MFTTSFKLITFDIPPGSGEGSGEGSGSMRSLVSYRTALRSSEEVLLKIVTRRNHHQEARSLMRKVKAAAAAGAEIGDTIELCDTQIYGDL